MHISEVEDKRAENLAQVLDDQGGKDTYHKNIITAARALRSNGMQDYRYETQWASGTTLWQAPGGKVDEKVTVTRDGRIES